MKCGNASPYSIVIVLYIVTVNLNVNNVIHLHKRIPFILLTDESYIF
jgi:hypothetical protein